MMKRKTFGTLLIVLGAVLVLSALGMTCSNLWKDSRAGKAAQESLEKLTAPLPQPEKTQENEQLPLLVDPAEIELYEAYPYMDMPEQEVDGRMYIGVLEIETLELRLPILSQWSDSDYQIAPCRYSGSAYQNDLVIAGHNYGSHFRRLSDLSIGDTVRFTDVDGNVFVYVMVDIELLNADQVEEIRTGDWDLTLFTCTVGGQQRIAIRCAREG